MFRLWVAAGVMAAITSASGQGEPDSHERICVMRLKTVALGTLLYIQANDMRMPPMTPQARMESAVNPYIEKQYKYLRGHKLASLWTCPSSGLSYIPNKVFLNPKRRLSLEKIPQPANTVLLRDPKPHADKKWRTAFVDGHVRAYIKLQKEGLR